MIDVNTGYLSDNVAIDQATPYTAAGTSTIKSSAIDMTGYDSVLIYAWLGTPAANNTLTLEDGATSTTAATVATTNHATDAPLILDVQNVALQFIKASVARGTSTTIEQVIVVRYNARKKPVTQAATTSVATFNAPALA